MLHRISVFVLAPLALVVASACGKVNPPIEQADAGMDAAGCQVPTQEEACAGKCGDVTVCEMAFSCGDDCAGELTCGGQTANTCGCASPPCAVGTFTAGDTSAQTIVDLAVDSAGNVFLAGNFKGTVTFGTTSYTSVGTKNDMFLVKMNPAGEALWSKQFRDVGAVDYDQLVRGIDVDGTGNVVIVGESFGSTNLGGSDLVGTNTDMVIGKLDKDGNHVFSGRYGTEYTIQAAALAIDRATQDIVVTGRFYGTVQFGSNPALSTDLTQGYFDIFVVRFAANGVPATSKRFGDPQEQVPESIATSGSSVFLSAYFTGTYNYGGPNVTSTSFYSLALTKLTTSTFFHGWTRQYGTDVINSQLAADATGNVFITGLFGGMLDIVSPSLDSAAGDTFLAKIDANGATVWAKQLANVNIADVTVDAAGTLYVAGYVDGAVDLGAGPVAYSGSSDPFVANYAADGSHIWSRVFTAAVGNQRSTSVDVAAGGTIWVGTNFDGTIDLGLGPVTTQGATDIAVMAYVP